MNTFGFINSMLKGTDESDENVPRLESAGVILLVRFNIVNNDYQQDSRFFINLFL